MQTVIGRFASMQDMDAALYELDAVRLNPAQSGAQSAAQRVSRLSRGLTWDLIAQICIVGGIVLGGLFGLLAGAGAFGGLHGHHTARAIWAGIFVGISLGMLLGLVVGALWGFLAPPARTTFQPTAVVSDDYIVTVATQDRWVPEAMTAMRHAHATRVDAREGQVDPIHLAA